VFPFVDGSRRILGSNYGWAVASVDFPRYAELHLAGRLPIEALVDERIALSADSIESAFDRMRRGEGIRTVIIP
jgi:Zn-dependent alcohol dehydrogenase